MDNEGFLQAFMGVNILAVQGVSETIGIVIAKLREGMIVGGMDQADVDKLLRDCVRIFLREMLTQGAAQHRGGER